MRITDVDPLDFDLIFERFLNPERVSLPDIDIDFCERRRGEVIEYVTKKYGRENVAQIITFGTMKAKAVVRDVGRVLEMPFADVDKVAKQIPAALDMTLDKALEENPILREMEKNDPKVKELLSVARRLEGMTRHASVHAAGVVIAPSAITNYAPLYKGARDEIVTQWSMKEIERVGLLKMDFLGLSTLTLIADAIEEIKRTTGETLDIDAIPFDDAKTYQVFQDGQTYGVFQFESSGMRDILRKAKPQRLDDLIALNALYRPGPLRSGMVDDYIARKQGKTDVVYELPALEPILADTYGVIAYQEQVMRIAQALAGFTLGQADVLRKAMGKKDPKVMAKQREAFMTGSQAKGISEKKATKIFDLMEYFAGYGFNKSHSTTYAYLAYQTAYLKANYPWHFAAALFTIESQNTEKLAMYLGEARERGIPVLPPDINQSQLRFTVEDKGVRFGLTAIKNVGEGAIESLIKVRAKQGRITSLHALCDELDLRLFNKRVFESLAKAGALDSLAAGVAGHARETRPRIVAAVDAACEYGARQQRDREQGQGGLFGEVQEADADGCRPGGRRAAGRDRVDRAGTTRVRKGNARPVLERASGRSLSRRAEGIRREGHRGAVRDADQRGAGGDVGTGRPQADAGRHVGRRRDRRRSPAQDEEGRSHGGLHARRLTGERRSDRLPRDLCEERGPHRNRHAGSGPRQARARRRDGEGAGHGDRAARQRARTRRARGRDPCQDARRSGYIRSARRRVLPPSGRSARVI